MLAVCNFLCQQALGLQLPLDSARVTQKTYLALKQPPYRPPPQVFGPVWTTLYGLMGYAAYRAWNTGISSLDPSMVSLTKVVFSSY